MYVALRRVGGLFSFPTWTVLSFRRLCRTVLYTIPMPPGLMRTVNRWASMRWPIHASVEASRGALEYKVPSWLRVGWQDRVLSWEAVVATELVEPTKVTERNPRCR